MSLGRYQLIFLLFLCISSVSYSQSKPQWITPQCDTTSSHGYSFRNYQAGSHSGCFEIKHSSRGILWTKCSSSSWYAINLMNMLVIDSLTVFVSAQEFPSHFVYKTSDGGINWEYWGRGFGFGESLYILNERTAYTISTPNHFSITRFSDSLNPKVFTDAQSVGDTVMHDTVFGQNFCNYDTISFNFLSNRYDIVLEQVLLGLEDRNQRSIPISIYPNPAGDFLYVDPTLNISKGSIRIIDARGSCFDTRILNSNRIDLRNIPKGLYFIKFTDEEIVRVGRFIKL